MSSKSRSASSISRLVFLSLLLLTGIMMAACTRLSQEAEQHPLQIELVEPLYPPGVGKYTLHVRVFDGDDNPINDAQVSIKADMTHAGMVPVLAEATEGDKGLYKVPFEWTMGGDWIVTVQVILPDGTIAEESFPMVISGDPANCDSEATETP